MVMTTPSETPKSAEDWLKQMKSEMPFKLPESIEPYILELAQAYGQQIGEQVRRECAEQFIDDGNIGSMYRESILSIDLEKFIR